MKTQTRNPTDEATETRLIPSTDLFAAFAVQRRQYTLAYLTQHRTPVSITDLAAFIAQSELGIETGADPFPTDRYERVLVDLYHVQLPHLADAGLVTYDGDTELVELTVDQCVLRPYLQLTDVDGDVPTTS